MIKLNSEIANNVLNDLRTSKDGIFVEFVKKDGSVRKMHATLNSSLMPSSKHPKETTTNETPRSAARVFDIEVGEWRSFIWENVTSINGEPV